MYMTGARRLFRTMQKETYNSITYKKSIGVLQELQGRRGLTQGSATGGGVTKAALDAARYFYKSNNGSWGAQLPLKQLTLLLLLFCCFLGFFLRCHVYLLTSYVVGFSCKQLLFLHSQNAAHDFL